MSLNRPLLVTSIRLRTGNIPLNAFGYQMRILDSPNYTTCNTREYYRENLYLARFSGMYPDQTLYSRSLFDICPKQCVFIRSSIT